MENQQQPPTTTLCRAGCGFFGAAATEGLCSKCYKDHIKRKQDTVAAAARISPTGVSSVPMAPSSSSPIPIESAPPSSPVSSIPSCSSSIDKAMSCSQAAHSSEEVAAKLESAVAAAQGHLSSSSSAVALESAGVAEISSSSILSSSAPVDSACPPPAKKVNRCGECKKRVGLTGFSCRCGGLFCSEHRYDTAHACSFDYKTMEREQLAKNNPVVVSDKIQRI